MAVEAGTQHDSTHPAHGQRFKAARQGVFSMQKCLGRRTPKNASSRLDFPSDCPPTATISGMGKLSPMATDVDCKRLQECRQAEQTLAVFSS